jgi:hypothetical protein
VKIFQGFREVGDVLPLIEEGADELFTGYFCAEDLPTRNHMKDDCGIRTRADLDKAIDLVHGRGLRIFLTLNDLYCTGEEVATFPAYAAELVRRGIDGFVVSNVPLLMALSAARLGVELCVSTLQPVFNASALAFFKRFGISRVVLPELIGAHEAEEILRDPDVKTEVFFWGSAFHPHIESYCLFHHRPDTYGRPCHGAAFHYCHQKPVVSAASEGVDPDAVRLVDTRFTDDDAMLRINGSGNLFDMHRLGCHYLKLATREFPFARKLAILKNARWALSMLDEGRMDREEFTRLLNERIVTAPRNPYW